MLNALLRYFEFNLFTCLPLCVSKNLTKFPSAFLTSFDAFEANGASIESM